MAAVAAFLVEITVKRNAAAPQAEYAVVEFDYFDGDIFRAVADSAATLRAMGVR